jgi:hypothetical protein
MHDLGEGVPEPAVAVARCQLANRGDIEVNNLTH